MASNLLFSFVIPVYNVSGFIERCVDSVLKQENSADCYELILVDDGSKDDSGEICDRLASENPNIKVIHKENGGLSSARNAGVKAASGEYVFFLDSDDTIRSSLISDVLKIKELTDYDIIIGQVEMVTDINKNNNSSEQFEYFKCSQSEILDLYTKCEIQGYAVCKFIRRSLILENNIEFPVGHNYEDIRTLYKFLIHSDKTAVMKKTYYNYFISNQTSITNNDSIKNLTDYFDSVEIMYRDLKQGFELPKLSCLRLNFLTQIYIRIYYYCKKNSQAIQLLEKVKSILDTEKVAIKEMKGYCHFKKYLLYRMKMLNALLSLKYTLNKSH